MREHENRGESVFCVQRERQHWLSVRVMTTLLRQFISPLSLLSHLLLFRIQVNQQRFPNFVMDMTCWVTASIYAFILDS